MNSVRRRGMTLVEVTLSIVFIVALGMISLRWIALLQHHDLISSARGNWEASVRDAVRSIREDVLCADFGSEPDPRLRITGRRVLIWSRDRGPVQRTYWFENMGGASDVLRCATSPLDHRRPDVLVVDVRSGAFEVVNDGRTLRLSLESLQGWRVTGDVQVFEPDAGP